MPTHQPSQLAANTDLLEFEAAELHEMALEMDHEALASAYVAACINRDMAYDIMREYREKYRKALLRFRASRKAPY
jgi:hypothetical protein